MKKIALMITLALALILTGCAGKTFDTGKGIRFTLPKEFAEDAAGGYDFAFSNELSLKDATLEEYQEKTIIIAGLRDSFADLAKSEPEIGEDLKKYVDFQMEMGDYRNLKELKNGYSADNVIGEYYYRYVFLKGSEAFYMVTFSCYDASSAAKAAIDGYIEKIKV
jgi:hypothetical protein